MRLILSSLLAVLLLSLSATAPKQAAHATTAAVIGHGCTTAFYIDADCDGCGDGVYASGTYTAVTSPTLPSSPTGYQIVQSPPGVTAKPYYTVSDKPDADDTDPTVCTTADWQAKWGTSNANMKSFLEAKKGVSNDSNIYYLSLAGNDGTGAVNDPTHPYKTTAPILTALSTGSPLPGGVVIIRGTTLSATGTISSSVLTVTVAPSPANLGPGELVTMAGVAPGTYISTDGTGSGGTGTYNLANPSSTIANVASATAFTAAWGYTLTFNANSVQNTNYGTYASGNPSFAMSGSEGHPLYVMSYPGEVVQTSMPWAPITGTPYGNLPIGVCCVTIDGLKWWDDQYDTQPIGDGALEMANATDMSVINSEFVGWDKVDFTLYMKNLVFDRNVEHDIFAHGVYLDDGTVGICGQKSTGEFLANGDFDFALDATNYAASMSCGSIYNPHVTNNVFYDCGQSGYDCVHMNAMIDAAVVTGNIIDYGGGNSMALMTGNYNDFISGNLTFDNADDCILIFVTFNQSVNPQATHNYNTYANNVCYQTNVSDSIRNANPTGGIYAADSSGFEILTGTPSSTGGTIGGSSLGYWDGPTASTYLTWLTSGQVLTSVTATNMSATLSWPSTTITGSPSAQVIIFPSGAVTHYIKNTTFANNIIVTYDDGSTLGYGNIDTDAIPFVFELHSYPETWSITGNTFYSSGTTSNRMAWIDINIDSTLAGGAVTSLSAFQALSASFSGNSYADPGFAAASPTYAQTPWLFNFAPHNLR